MTPPISPPEMIRYELEVIEEQRKKENEEKAWRIEKPGFFRAWQTSIMINRFARRNGTMVRRSIKFIQKNYYLVALSLDSFIIGTIGMTDWGKEGIELISHCVYSDFGNMGVGTRLFEELLKEVKRRKPPSLFLCTASAEYYRHLGFIETDSKKYTEKLRRDCSQCKNGPLGPGFPPCPEIVMEYSGII